MTKGAETMTKGTKTVTDKLARATIDLKRMEPSAWVEKYAEDLIDECIQRGDALQQAGSLVQRLGKAHRISAATLGAISDAGRKLWDGLNAKGRKHHRALYEQYRETSMAAVWAASEAIGQALEREPASSPEEAKRQLADVRETIIQKVPADMRDEVRRRVKEHDAKLDGGGEDVN